MIVQTPKEYARERAILTGLAFALGLPIGAIVQNGIGFACATPVVSAVLMKTGDYLCREWSGLRNVQRVSDTAYTFTCGKYATFSSLEVTQEKK